MAILLSVQRLKKRYGARPLFDGLSFAIESGERIGLIGPNGAGKSTLLAILAGHTNPDEGEVTSNRGLRVGYLEQSPRFTPGASILETVLEGAATRASENEWEHYPAALEQMSRLELDIVADAESPVERLSGGWKKRVALARELMKNPDVLLLDEPTNHLDMDSILWLENWIERSGLTTLTITHDRMFLQRVSNRILELDARNADGVLSVRGDYAAYLETKDLLISSQERREVILKNTLRRETEWLRRGAKARTTKQQARIQRHGEITDEFQDVAARNKVKTARLDFETSSKLPKKLIDAKGISKKYGDRVLFSGLDLRLSPGTRLGLLGRNGCGKSTLIRILLGQEAPDTGTVEQSDHLQVAYFSQNREALDPLATVAQTLCPRGEYVEFRGGRVHIKSYLDRFLFTSQQMDMPIGRLSGGEQSRVLIAQLMLQPANVLVLDEPTNDLDMATLNVLEECLTDFEGAIVLVSHDRYFLDQISTQLLSFETGKVVPFADLEQWEKWRAENRPSRADAVKALRLAAQASSAETAAKEANAAGAGVSGTAGASAAAGTSATAGAGAGTSGSAATSGAASAAGSAASKKRLGFKEQRELDGMEAKIHETEKKLADASVELEKRETAANPSRLRELSAMIPKLQNDIDTMYARWEEMLAQA